MYLEFCLYLSHRNILSLETIQVYLTSGIVPENHLGILGFLKKTISCPIAHPVKTSAPIIFLVRRIGDAISRKRPVGVLYSLVILLEFRAPLVKLLKIFERDTISHPLRYTYLDSKTIYVRKCTHFLLYQLCSVLRVII